MTSSSELSSSGNSTLGRRRAPRKSLGQHFLRDRSIVKRIVGAARLEGGQDTVIEIGPGRVLSGLVKRAGPGLTALNLDSVDSLEALRNV